jgi:6-phosphogluconolactonase
MTIDSIGNLQVFETAETVNTVAVDFIIDIANKAIAERGRFVICLSGGQTPQQLYSLLAELPFCKQIQWKKTFVFWGDERCVPLNDERNNAHQAKIILLDKVDVPFSNIHRIPVNILAAEAAAEYEKEIKLFFNEGVPRFDLILLGLGENGHTASLFPGTKVINEQVEGIREVYVEEERMYRVTMTAPLINRARHILFLVTGKNKAEILNKILSAPFEPDKYPAQLIRPIEGQLHWFIDSAAAAFITN